METHLIQFIDTLDTSLKTLQQEVGDGSGISKLTVNQFRYLDAIHDLGEPTITEIASRLQITKASVTIGVNKLIQMGFLTKSQSNLDKRVFHVRLTETAQPLVQAKYQALQEYGELIRSALSEEEITQFEAIIDKLVRAFQQRNQGGSAC